MAKLPKLTLIADKGDVKNAKEAMERVDAAMKEIADAFREFGKAIERARVALDALNDVAVDLNIVDDEEE